MTRRHTRLVQPLTVLIAQHCLTGLTGTELYTRDVALALQRQGHRPVVFTTAPGAISVALQGHGVMVISSLAELAITPDVVHGNHLFETLAALTRFPQVPTVFVCHDWETWHSEPPQHTGIRRYVGVDEACLDRIGLVSAVPTTRTVLVQNGVDLKRFRPRLALPDSPTRALVFSNAATDANYLPSIREACRIRGVALDVIGAGSGHPVAAPEDLLGGYDVVFAKGRAALEALAVGCAVVLCDALGLGGLVTSAEYDGQRARNLGRRCLTRPVSIVAVLAELDRYDAQDGAAVSDRVRATAGLDAVVGQLVQVYRDAIADRVADPRPQPDWWVGQLEMAARGLFDRDDARLHAAHLEREVSGLRQQVANLQTDFAKAQEWALSLDAARTDLEQQRDRAEADFAKAQEWALSLDAARTDLEQQQQRHPPVPDA